MKCDTEQKMKLEQLYKVGSEWVQIPLRPTFYSYFKESFRGEYHMYWLISLHSRDYLKKIWIKKSVATEEGDNRNKM